MKGLIVIALAAAGIGGGTLWLLSSEDEPETVAARAAEREVDDAERTGPQDTGSLDARVARLERRVKQLEAASGRARLGAMGDWSDRRRDSNDSYEVAADGPLADQVRAIVEDERANERERGMERRRERWEARSEEQLEDLTAKVGLSAEVREQVSAMWTDEREKMMTMFTEARAGDRDFREVRGQIQTLREQTDQSAQAIMTEPQYEAYTEMRSESRWGGGGGGRGRGGGRQP